MIFEPHQLLTTAIPALTSDGARGRVRLALLSPGHWRLLALVVRYGRLSPHNVIVPINEVATLSDKQVRLRLNRAELLQQQAFRPAAQRLMALGGTPQALAALQYGRAGLAEHVLQVSPHTAHILAGRKASPTDGLIALRAGLPVMAGTERVGWLGRLLFDKERRLRQIVVRTGRLFGRDIAVPVAQVAGFDEDRIQLELDRAAFEQLPEYRDDSLVKRDVERALWDDDLIRRIDLPTIDVSVSVGTVVLRGHAMAATSPARAELAARGVPGVREVINRIITDGELHLAVADALGRDERTRAQPLRVYVKRGVVVLNGAADDPAMCAAAEAVAGSVPGVRAVISKPAQGSASGEEPRALFPRVGQEVYASQTHLGQVERVIVHPRHRRVTALVLRGQAAGRLEDEGNDGAAAQPDQELIIPVEAVRTVTQAAVLLRDDDAATRYAGLRLKADAPGPDWQPPYPYTRAEVLIERGRSDAAPSNSAYVGEAV